MVNTCECSDDLASVILPPPAKPGLGVRQCGRLSRTWAVPGHGPGEVGGWQGSCLSGRGPWRALWLTRSPSGKIND